MSESLLPGLPRITQDQFSTAIEEGRKLPGKLQLTAITKHINSVLPKDEKKTEYEIAKILAEALKSGKIEDSIKKDLVNVFKNWSGYQKTGHEVRVPVELAMKALKVKGHSCLPNGLIHVMERFKNVIMAASKLPEKRRLIMLNELFRVEGQIINELKKELSLYEGEIIEDREKLGSKKRLKTDILETLRQETVLFQVAARSKDLVDAVDSLQIDIEKFFVTDTIEAMKKKVPKVSEELSKIESLLLQDLENLKSSKNKGKALSKIKEDIELLRGNKALKDLSDQIEDMISDLFDDVGVPRSPDTPAASWSPEGASLEFE